jgi:hypothetical protein
MLPMTFPPDAAGSSAGIGCSLRRQSEWPQAERRAPRGLAVSRPPAGSAARQAPGSLSVVEQLAWSSVGRRLGMLSTTWRLGAASAAGGTRAVPAGRRQCEAFCPPGSSPPGRAQPACWRSVGAGVGEGCGSTGEPARRSSAVPAADGLSTTSCRRRRRSACRRASPQARCRSWSRRNLSRLGEYLREAVQSRIPATSARVNIDCCRIRELSRRAGSIMPNCALSAEGQKACCFRAFDFALVSDSPIRLPASRP